MEGSDVAVDDIWNCLPTHYPTREDRDRLVALGDPRRVAVWDFFFSLEVASVVRPLEEEKASCSAKIIQLQKETEAEACRVRTDMEQYESERLREQERSSANLKKLEIGPKKLIEKVELQRRVSFVCLGLIVLFVLLSIIEPQSDLGPPIFLSAIVGVALYFRSVDGRKEILAQLSGGRARESERLRLALEELDKSACNLKAFLDERHSRCTAEVATLTTWIQALENRIAIRFRQVPNAPAAEKVNNWFLDDLEELKATLLRDSGQEGRLVRARTAPNIFCIRGPAELQNRDQIAQIYDEDPNLKKHLEAKKAGKAPDGRVFDLYGVWIIEFLFLGQDELTSYRVFFDFITGLKSTTLRTHPYNAVALVETSSHFRKIKVSRNGSMQDDYVDNVPSLAFVLENGQRIEVSFPNSNYIKESFPDVDPDLRSYDPVQEAKEAIAILSENVHNARSQDRSLSAMAGLDLGGTL